MKTNPCKVDENKLRQAAARIQKSLKREFGPDESGDPRVEMSLTDRTRYQRSHFTALPYYHLCENAWEYFEVFRTALSNLTMAMTQVQSVVLCLRQVQFEEQRQTVLRSELKCLFKSTPFSIEPNYGFCSFAEPGLRLARSQEVYLLDKSGHEDLRVFLDYVKKCQLEIVKKHRSRIKSFVVVMGNTQGRVAAWVKMTPAEQAQAKLRQRARLSLLEKEEQALRNKREH